MGREIVRSVAVFGNDAVCRWCVRWVSMCPTAFRSMRWFSQRGCSLKLGIEIVCIRRFAADMLRLFRIQTDADGRQSGFVRLRTVCCSSWLKSAALSSCPNSSSSSCTRTDGWFWRCGQCGLPFLSPHLYRRRCGQCPSSLQWSVRL